MEHIMIFQMQVHIGRFTNRYPPLMLLWWTFFATSIYFISIS